MKRRKRNQKLWKPGATVDVLNHIRGWGAHHSHRHTPEQVITYGVSFPPRPLPKRYPKGWKGSCFENSYIMMREHSNLIYCEGFAWVGEAYSPSGRFYLHGWCVDHLGRVYDKTILSGFIQEGGYMGLPFEREFAKGNVVSQDEGEDWFGILYSSGGTSGLSGYRPEEYLHPEFYPFDLEHETVRQKVAS